MDHNTRKGPYGRFVMLRFIGHLSFTLYTDKLYTFLVILFQCFSMTYNIFFIYYVFQMSDAGVKCDEMTDEPGTFILLLLPTAGT